MKITVPTILGCPWETHERQPCELLEYTRDHRCTCLPLLLRRDDELGNSQRVGLYHGARGTLFFRRHPIKGQQGEIGTFPWSTPRLSSQRQPKIVNTNIMTSALTFAPSNSCSIATQANTHSRSSFRQQQVKLFNYQGSIGFKHNIQGGSHYVPNSTVKRKNKSHTKPRIPLY